MQTRPNLGEPRARHWFRLQLVLCGTIAALHGPAAAAQQAGAKRTFNIPAQGAESALKVFSEQSGKGVIMNANTVDGIRTNRLDGAFAPLEALQRLLAGTGLMATPDEKSAAFVVHRLDKPPNGRTPPAPSGDRAQKKTPHPSNQTKNR